MLAGRLLDHVKKGFGTLINGALGGATSDWFASLIPMNGESVEHLNSSCIVHVLSLAPAFTKITLEVCIYSMFQLR